MENVCRFIDKAKELTFLTDGERRYGKILFELCSVVLKTENGAAILRSTSGKMKFSKESDRENWNNPELNIKRRDGISAAE